MEGTVITFRLAYDLNIKSYFLIYYVVICV